jgi:glycosyltransferase involved in cell wall biosynthesis/trans-aconitate methyltransferase
MEKPRFSVAMCTYNGARFLREQLHSIVAQSVPVQEIVICDDNSRDETCAVVEAFSREHPGLVRLYRNNKTLGYSQNFARAVSLCRGDIIFLSDQDDSWFPNRVERMAALFASDEQCAVISVAALVTDQGLKPTGKRLIPMSPARDEKPSTFSARIHQSSAYGCTLAFRASLRPVFSPISPHWGHDNWICFIAARFTGICGIEEPLMYFRRHRASAGMNDKLDFGALGQLMAAVKRSKRLDYEHDRQKWQDMNQQLMRIIDGDVMRGVPSRVVPCPKAILNEARARLAFSEARFHVTARSRPLRLAPALRILFTGQYAEFASGWKSFLKDLLIGELQGQNGKVAIKDETMPNSLHTRDWEEMAKVDPLWAILADPAKRFKKWDLDEFLRTGEEEIRSLMESAGQLGLPARHGRAIDFGCGVGRLTRALRTYFTDCHGVDISRSMLEMARRLTPECDFREASNLSSFTDGYADLIYSNLVLQHQPDPTQAGRLIADMIRVLAPGGLLVFQMPVHLPWRNRLQLRRRVYRLLRAVGLRHSFAYDRLKLSPIRMVALPQTEVERIVIAANGSMVRVDHTNKPGDPFVSGIYYCTKKS